MNRRTAIRAGDWEAEAITARAVFGVLAEVAVMRRAAAD